MQPGIYIDAVKRRAGRIELSSQFYQDCLTALAGPERNAAMVLDEHGEVIYCNGESAALFDRTADEVVGRHLSDIVLNLHLNAWTPENNMAFASFSGQRNHWREYCFLDSRGRGYPVEILLDTLVVELRQLILLRVRIPERSNRKASAPAYVANSDGKSHAHQPVAAV